MRRFKASAISYAAGDYAPRVVAKGRGREAERIVELASEAGVEVVEDAALAALLDATDVGACIPGECWEAVAAVLAFIKAEEGR
jgi:flagellar biosynthesis protein